MRSLGRALSLTLALGLGLSLGLGGSAAAAADGQAAKKKAPAATSRTGKKPQATRYSARAASARRATLARARAANRARAVRDTLPRFKLDALSGSLVPDLHAAAAIIYNPETNEVVWEENSQDKRSIASITKVMTATVFVESEPDFDQQVTIDRSDVWQASVTNLRVGEQVKADDLLHLALIASDNGAARALARSSSYGPEGFVARMNEKAAELGLASTTYTDPSGLEPTNVSSAYDMARLIAYAAGDERISAIMRMPSYTFSTNRHTLTIRSTNQLVRMGGMDVRGGKTGFISQAGYCLATLLNLPDLNQPFAVVVLGARSNAGRFLETRNLYQWLTTKAQEFLSRKQGG